VLARQVKASELQPIDLTPLSAKPLVSILLSNYNYGRFIGDAIRSALQQTYSSIELIICDDGSTDDSLRIIEGFAGTDARLQLISKANGGQASGFNAAFAASRGEIIALLDSDDLFLPDKVEKIVADFQRNPGAGFGVHRVIRMNADLQPQGVWPMSAPLPEGWYGSFLLQNGGVLPNTPPTSGLSLHRDVANRLFPLPLEAPLGKCPDQVITRLAPLLTVVTCENHALASYRLHGQNSYGPDRVTPESVQRELMFSAALWEEQKRFLTEMNPQLAEDFQPLSGNLLTTQLKYIYARLTGAPDALQRYHQMVGALSQPDANHIRFWKLSRFLPRSVFSFAINLLIRQSRLKQWLSRLKKRL
jgi:hypothetical protein